MALFVIREVPLVSDPPSSLLPETLSTSSGALSGVSSRASSGGSTRSWEGESCRWMGWSTQRSSSTALLFLTQRLHHLQDHHVENHHQNQCQFLPTATPVHTWLGAWSLLILAPPFTWWSAAAATKHRSGHNDWALKAKSHPNKEVHKSAPCHYHTPLWHSSLFPVKNLPKELVMSSSDFLPEKTV